MLPAPMTGRPWRRAAAYLAVLGPFFFLSYGLANWWTARLPVVDSVVFDWERHIPFLAWTIVPYLSLDLCYAASLFLCATRAELDAHARRLLGASVVSVAGFLLFPLKCSFVRPAASGLNGALFEGLTAFDKPYNQAPSLHVSVGLLVWLVFARHLRGPARWLAHGWFGLIMLSVFTTYQHHVIDGVAGAAVGVALLYLFPDAPRTWRRPPGTAAAGSAPALDAAWRHRLARFYALGAALCLGLAAGLGGWAWVLLWPAAALGLVALAYAGLGVRVFQKHDGRLSLAAALLLAPYRLGAWYSSRWLTRRAAPAVEVVPGIWLGRMPGRADGRRWQPAAVLDLTAEFSLSRAARTRPHRSLPLLDLVAPTPAELRTAAVTLAELHAELCAELVAPSEPLPGAAPPAPPVLVHCALGYSRSAVVVAAWLLHTGQAATPAEAVAWVRAARPQVVLPAAHRAALAAYAAVWLPAPATLVALASA